MASFDTLYDCFCSYQGKPEGYIENVTHYIHGVPISMNIYRHTGTFYITSSAMTTIFPNCSKDGPMQVLICDNLDNRVTLTPPYRCKGLAIHCFGSLINRGTITMTERGANASGQNIFLCQNMDGSYEYVPATGAPGAARTYSVSQCQQNDQWLPGKTGGHGSGRQSGGGGSGAVVGGWYSGLHLYSGSGGWGTSYAGGAGSGGCFSQKEDVNYWLYSYDASSVYGSDGVGYVGNWTLVITGGTGVEVGKEAGGWWGAHTYIRGNYKEFNKCSGSGGLLIVFADTISGGWFQSCGSSNNIVGAGAVHGPLLTANGGSSGGGSINIFGLSHLPSVWTSATGGSSGWGSRTYGGAGGNGAVAVQQLKVRKYIYMDSQLRYYANSWHPL